MTVTNFTLISIFTITVYAIIFKSAKIELFTMNSITFPTFVTIAFVPTWVIDTSGPVVTIVIFTSYTFVYIMTIWTR